ncbi:MAG: CbiX/SirB N-terminal domain-containing protein [Planctomycetota bacterium]
MHDPLTKPDRVTGVVIVDHGSRRTASNDLLLRVVDEFRSQSDWSIVEPAHMELAEPSIETAFSRCVTAGATRVVVFPYFLAPGRHWTEDIPRLTAEAAAAYPEVEWLVTAPLGLHPSILAVIDDRIDHCLSRVAGQVDACEICSDQAGCIGSREQC